MKSPKEMSKHIRMKKYAYGGMAKELPLDDDGAHEKHEYKYAYGGRVLDERPGKDQGPEDSDLQDHQITREDETAEQNDRNKPLMRDAGQMLSNAAEDAEEMQKQKNHEGENAEHRNDEKELLRNVRKSRIRSRMR